LKRWGAGLASATVQRIYGPGEDLMWDLLALAFTVVFLALALWYAQGCEKLR